MSAIETPDILEQPERLRSGPLWPRAVDGVVGLVLLLSAALKALSPSDAIETAAAYGMGYWLMIPVVQAEVLIAMLLFSGWQSRKSRQLGALLFAIFGVFSLTVAMQGHDTCGCFGSLKMHPWVMFAIDVAAVWALLLAAAAPRSTENLSSMKPTYTTVYLILAITAFALMLWHQPATLGGNTLIDDSTDLVILEPEEWIGQELPLTKYLTPPVNIKDGVVLIYHHDCPDCQRALPMYVDLANSVPMERQVVLVEVPPLGEPGAYGVATHTTLKANKDWFVEAPVEVRIQGGQVTSVKSSDAILTDDLTPHRP